MARTTLDETQLAAATPALLARPSLWNDLHIAARAGGPWATYWRTRIDPRHDAVAARARFAAALAGFDAAGERLGALLCCAGAIETYYDEEGTLAPLDEWIGRLQSLLPTADGWPSAEVEAQVMACGAAINLRSPTCALLQEWAARGKVLVHKIAPGAVRARLATFLIQYHLWRGELGPTALLADVMPGLDLAGALPHEALRWHQSVASHARFCADFERGRSEVQAALGLARRHHLHGHLYGLHAHGAAIALAALDADTAASHLEAMRPGLDRQSLPDQTHYWHYGAGLALLRGEVPQALELARTTLAQSLQIGGPYRSALHRLALGQVLLRSGAAADALAQFNAVGAQADSIAATLLGFSAALMAAAALQALGRAEASRQRLREAAAIGAREAYRTTAGWWLAPEMGQLVAEALRWQIEPAWFSQLISRHALHCPDPQLAAWPWPIKLWAFGPLRIEVRGQALARPSGRSAERPLDLLRALLASAPAPLTVATALEWLWPDSMAADQRKAFDVTLHRLRRLLGDDAALQLGGGRLQFDAARVWSDVAAWADLRQRAWAGDAPALIEQGRAMLALVRAPLLDGTDSSWAQAARERQRQRFVLALGECFERLRSSDEDAASALLEHALDADPTLEALARRLMRQHAAHGRPTEARRVWQQTVAMLQLQRGLPPAPETTALARELKLDP